MSSNSTTPQAQSPLDPFLVQFLRELDTLETGYSPASHASVVAEECGFPPSFAEALFTSARARGLIEPFRSRHVRGRIRWRLSQKGHGLLATTAESTATT